MNARDVIKRYLYSQHMMQLATVSGGQPWVCTVYFVVDDMFNVYWASLPTRRHSREILEGNGKVAVAIPVAFVKGEPVAGLQIQGTAEMLEDSATIRPIAELYAKKFNRDQQWLEDFVSLKTEHRLWKLSPSLYVLFDEVNFKNNPRQEFTSL